MDGDTGDPGLERRLGRLEARVQEIERRLDAEVAGEAEATGPLVSRAPFPPAPPMRRAPFPPAPPMRSAGWGEPVQRGPSASAPGPVAPGQTPSPDVRWGSPPPPEPMPEGVAAAAAGEARVAIPTLATAAWQAPAKPAPSFNLRDLEERFAGQALAWIGGFALVAAAVFFLSLAFSRGWITQPMRVVIGFVAAALILGVGALCFDRRNPLLGNVLTATGLGITSITLFAATRAYGLLSPELGLAAALAAAIAAAVIAIRYDAREVAAYGLIAALIAPPVMGASPTTLTLLFVAVTLIGTTAIAVFRSWRWLPSIAFVLAAPQLASWLLSADTAQGLVALAGFWLVNTVAAGGEEVRIRRDDLRPSSAVLVLANAAVLTWGGNVVLEGPTHVWLGTFFVLASVAHLAVGGAFLRRQGLEHLFGNLVAGTGVALLALAAFVQLGAALVPVAWAVEGAALAWLAARRLHRWSALAAIALGSLAALHLAVVEYPLDRLEVGTPLFAVPLLHPEAASLAAVVAAVAVAGWFAPVAWIRSALAAVGAAVVGYAALFEANGPALTLMLVVVAIAALELDVLVERAGTRADLVRFGGLVRNVWFATATAAALGLTAGGALIGLGYPAVRWGSGLPAVPYTDAPAASLAIILAGLAIVGAQLGTRAIRSTLAAVAVLLVTWSLPFELGGTSQIAVGAVLLPLAVVGDRALARFADARRLTFIPLPAEASSLASGAGAVAWLAALVTALGGDLRPLPWRGWGLVGPPFTDETTLVAVVLAGAAIAAAAWTVTRWGQQAALLAALVPLAIAVPHEVKADFVVVLWLLIAGAALAVTRPADGLRPVSAGFAALLATSAVAVTFGLVAPPDRLWVAGGADWGRPALLAGWWAAVAAVAGVALLASRRPELASRRALLQVASAATGVYLASVAIVDPFQRMVGGTVPVEELAKQAQVAMSVTWTAIGALALGVGLRSRHAMPRHIGFGILSLATAKVFTVDLAAMDVGYRAVVLAGLGVLLLLSAWLFTHLRGQRPGTPGAPGLPGPRAVG